MPYVIAVAGKGGTGKTTIAAIIVQLLRERGEGPILAVDADPNTNFGEALGIPLERTIGELREETLEQMADLPPGVPRDRYLELGLHECLVEDEGVDLLAMGHGEGPKCYCMVNHVLRRTIGALRANYRYVVIDNEAGMEHLSRRTTQDVDALLIVAQPDPISIRSAGRIGKLAEALKLRVEKKLLVLNSLQGELPAASEQALATCGLPLLGKVPRDEGVLALALAGQPLEELPPTSPARLAVAGLLEKLFSGKEG